MPVFFPLLPSGRENLAEARTEHAMAAFMRLPFLFSEMPENKKNPIFPFRYNGQQTAKISDSPSGLSVQLRWGRGSLPSRMATVETPAEAGVSTFAPYQRVGFQTGVGFTMTKEGGSLEDVSVWK
ncbi:MAG: hypothetical protein LBF51_01890 [Zoogloeaceae bacterium]|jgi:hypothetical protein|nr:hypothetical protein [Zoogloeaceae bacterium]